jgi:hypothetical protein
LGSSDIEVDSPPQYPDILDWLRQVNADLQRNLDRTDYMPHAELLRQNGINSLADMAYVNSDQLQALGLNLGVATCLTTWSMDYRDKLLRKKKWAKYF